MSQNYDRLRFDGPSGEWVNQRELAMVTSLLPPSGKILDLGCGTGRLSLYLQDLGYEVVAIDSSAEMLAVARSKEGGKRVTWLQGDAFALPVQHGSFDVVVALRLAFHFADLRRVLAAAINATKPGGTIVLDTYNWSVRALVPLGKRTWGSPVYIHYPRRVMRDAAALGLELVEKIDCFLFSPFVYRLLPLSVARGLGYIEPLLPACLKARVFWHLRSFGGGPKLT